MHAEARSTHARSTLGRSVHARCTVHAHSSAHARSVYALASVHARLSTLTARCMAQRPWSVRDASGAVTTTRSLATRPLPARHSRRSLFANPSCADSCEDDSGDIEEVDGWLGRLVGSACLLGLSARLVGSACRLGLGVRATCGHGRRSYGHERCEKSTPKRVSAVRLVCALA